MNTLCKNSYCGYTSSIVIGIIWIAIVFWLCVSFFEDFLEELALIQRGQTVSGLIVDTWEDVEESDSGQHLWYHGATYVYELPDGQIIRQNTKQASGRLKPEFRNLASAYPVQVVYLPEKPTISRIKGEEQGKVETWVIRKAGVGLIFLAVFLSPGIAILVSGIRSHVAQRDSGLSDETSNLRGKM